MGGHATEEQLQRRLARAEKKGDSQRAQKLRAKLNARNAAPDADAESAGKNGKKRKDRQGKEEDVQQQQQQQQQKKKSEPATKRARKSGEEDDAATMAWRETNGITVAEAGFPPCLTFDDSSFRAELLAAFTAKFEKPTPIQSQTWPILSSGRDAVGIAETGSGKTLAFSLPGLERCLTEERTARQGAPSPFMLVLAPTRELAKQSDDVLNEIDSISSVCIYGGVPKHEQNRQLRQRKNGRPVDCVVATPGRLLDLISEDALSLADVRYLVLDEADRMLDMGFERDVRRIISECHKSHQTAMFSATWPREIRKLASEFMNNPVRVTVGSDDLSANKRVEQHIEVFADERKRGPRLLQLLNEVHGRDKDRVLVFALYKKEAARLHQMLEQRGFKVGTIHGDMNQVDRQRAMDSFRDKSVPLLVATDVAARGLDIPDVECVINYAFPLTVEDYVHRIGRTGRAGKVGVSYTFFHDGDKNCAGGLVNILRDAGQHVPEELTSRFSLFTKKKEHGMYGAHFKNVDVNKAATRITFSDSE